MLLLQIKDFSDSSNFVKKPSVWIFSLHLAIQQGMFETRSDQERTKKKGRQFNKGQLRRGKRIRRVPI